TAVGRWLSAALAARFDAAEMGSPGGLGGTWGGELRLALGQGALGFAVSAGVLAPTVSSFGSVAVREQRFPLAAVVSLGRELPRGLRLAGELGLAVVPFTLRGEGLDTVAPATRLDVGARLGGELRLPLLAEHLAPFIGLHAEYFPRDYAFAVDPLGDVGTSSHLWLGASLGAAFEVDRRR
ncbi:MAG TPA: hypothetical protein VHO06_21695, partial [Polyangia bacterium]|nr:hypothetical protein [Polyangia bacterium]